MGRKDLTAGSFGSFGERAARTLAAAAREQPAPRDGPDDADTLPPGPGPWVRVRLPEHTGTLVMRAVRWRRSTSGAWALVVAAPQWHAIADWTGEGGWEPGPAEGYQVAPADHVTPIPGQDYGRLPRPLWPPTCGLASFLACQQAG